MIFGLSDFVSVQHPVSAIEPSIITSKTNGIVIFISGNVRQKAAWLKLCQIIGHLQWRRASDMKLNADAPPLQFRLPEWRLGGQSQNYQSRLELGLRLSD